MSNRRLNYDADQLSTKEFIKQYKEEYVEDGPGDLSEEEIEAEELAQIKKKSRRQTAILVFILFYGLFIALGVYTTEYENGIPVIVNSDARQRASYVQEVQKHIDKIQEIHFAIADVTDKYNRTTYTDIQAERLIREHQANLQHEINVLETIDPPDSFAVFHKTFIETAKVRADANQKLLDYFSDFKTEHITEINTLLSDYNRKMEQVLLLYGRLIKMS